MTGRSRGASLGRATIGGVAAFLLLGAPAASAHPLGNFSVNHSHNLTFQPNRIIDRAIVDFAEIPTAQSKAEVDLDGNGSLTADELDTHGRSQCAALSTAMALTVASVAVPLAVVQSSYALQEGQAGLPTGRLECRLEAAVDLSRSSTVALADDFAGDRVGWHEISAIGDGVRLIDSPVPQASATDELRNYPVGLLDSPLDVRHVDVAVEPGASTTASTATQSATPAPASSTEHSLFGGGPFAGAVDRITGTFNDMVGKRDLTLGVGLAAVALAMILGASHALLPGHGKTVMAAYIAGRQGSSRDAVAVGATVTITHTGGVLLLGLALTASSSLAGESVLGWLGVASGLLITSLGAGLLWNALRHRPIAHGHRHDFGHGHHHHHDHGHGGHHHDHRHRSPAEPSGVDRHRPRRVHVGTRGLDGDVVVVPSGLTLGTSVANWSSRSSGIVAVRRRPTRSQIAVTPSSTLSSAPRLVQPTLIRAAVTRPVDVTANDRRMSRRGLVGMGIAGGLVPSPSALIVLLSAIALGRTVFGIVLVIGYGLGMATTLTLAGLLLVRVRDRLAQRARGGRGRVSAMARRWSTVMPYATAMLVVVVGLGISIRGLGSIAG
jgi:nickel/cobalt transporter (NicO) family protein